MRKFLIIGDALNQSLFKDFERRLGEAICIKPCALGKGADIFLKL